MINSRKIANKIFLDLSFPSAISLFHKSTKMGPSNDTKIIEMADALAKTSFTLNLKYNQMCPDLLRMRALVKKYFKTTIYLADTIFYFFHKIFHQTPFMHCRIEKSYFLKPF